MTAVIADFPQISFSNVVRYATRPWQSVDALTTRRVNERQEEIDACLRCEYPECWNCKAFRRKRGGN